MLAFQPAPAPATFAPRLHGTVRPARRPVAVSAATYQRRRFVAGLLLALVVLAAVVGVSWVARPAPGELDLRPIAQHEVVVQPGDTVWSIASSLAGGTDVRPVVDAIVAANGGADLVVGQQLTIDVP